MSPIESGIDASDNIPLKRKTDIELEKFESGQVITCQPVKLQKTEKDGDQPIQIPTDDCDCCSCLMFCSEYCGDWCKMFACMAACIEGNCCLECINSTCESFVLCLEGCGECCVSCGSS